MIQINHCCLCLCLIDFTQDTHFSVFYFYYYIALQDKCHNGFIPAEGNTKTQCPHCNMYMCCHCKIKVNIPRKMYRTDFKLWYLFGVNVVRVVAGCLVPSPSLCIHHADKM